MRDRELTTRVVMIMLSKTSPRAAMIAGRSGIGPARSGPHRIGPTEIQTTAQESLLIGYGLAKPEVAGVVPEIPDAEVLDSNDVGGVDVFIVETRMDGLGVGLAGVGARGWPDGRPRGLEMGGAGDPGRAEQLVGLTEDAERPILAASVRVKSLRLLPVSVADLLQRRIGRDPEDFERVDLEADQGHVASRCRGTCTAQ